MQNQNIDEVTINYIIGGELTLQTYILLISWTPKQKDFFLNLYCLDKSSWGGYKTSAPVIVWQYMGRWVSG